MRSALRAGLVALTAASLLVSVTAGAQQFGNPAFDLERLSLDPSGQGSLIVGGGRVLPKGAMRLGFAAQYELDPLVLHLNDSNAGALVSNRVMAHVLAGFGITDHLEIGAELPIIMYQNGQDLSKYGLSPVEAQGLSNPLVSARYSFLKPGNDAKYALAAGLILGLPFGSPKALGGSGGFSVTPDVQGSMRAGPTLLSLQLGALLEGAQTIDTRKIGSAFDAQASVQWAKNAWRPELIARTDVALTGNIPAGGEVDLAARHNLGKSPFEAFALAGMGLGGLPGTPVFRGLLGLAWRSDLAAKPAAEPCLAAPPPKCPECAPPPPPPPPPAVKDPCAPGQMHTPAQCPNLDDDGDGVPNGMDKCPLQHGAVANNGCPSPDRDHDGVPDVDDECPDQPGPAANLGCPTKDRDHDGVADEVDNCPDVKGPASNHGCPANEKQLVYIQRERVSRLRSRIKLAAAVNFRTGSAVIPKSSYKALNQLAAVLNAHPELTSLEVQGHTDNAGRVRRNLRLSQRRAKAVEKYLEKHGVDSDRLTAKGYGEDKPIADNGTAAGRARNRRVEIVSADEGGQQ